MAFFFTIDICINEYCLKYLKKKLIDTLSKKSHSFYCNSSSFKQFKTLKLALFENLIALRNYPMNLLDLGLMNYRPL